MKPILAILFGLVFPVFASAQDFLPVPKNWSPDHGLSVPELNFSITAASRDARWVFRNVPGLDAKATLFMTEDPAQTGNASLIVIDKSFGSMGANSEQRTKEFIDGMSKGMPPGWSVSETAITDVDIPVKGSYRVSSRLNAPNRNPFHQYAYFVTGTKTYYFVTYTESESEPAFFTSTVRNFRLTDPSANVLPSQSALGLIHRFWSPTLVVLILVAIVGDIVRLRRKGSPRPQEVPRIDPTEPPLLNLTTEPPVTPMDKWGLFQTICGILYVATVSFLANFSRDGAYVLGTIIGGTLFPFILAFLIYRRSPRNWNRFARWFFWSCLIISTLRPARAIASEECNRTRSLLALLHLSGNAVNRKLGHVRSKSLRFSATGEIHCPWTNVLLALVSLQRPAEKI
jgi:hypothetical protein